MAFAVLVPLQGLAEAFEYASPSPRLILTSCTPSTGPPITARSVRIQSNPAAISEKSPEPVLLRTFTATMSASGATPTGATAPFEVMIPDTRTRTLAGSARAAPAQKGGRMRVAKTVLGNQIVGQIRMIRIDSRVENRHFHAGSRVSKTVRIIPPNETHTLCEYRMYFCVQIQELHLSVQRQTINRRPLHPESNPAEGAVSALHLKAPMGEGVQNTLLTRLDCNPSRPPDRRQIVLAQRNTDRDPLRLQIRLEQATEMSAKAGRSADRALRLHGQRVLARSGGNVHAA